MPIDIIWYIITDVTPAFILMKDEYDMEMKIRRAKMRSVSDHLKAGAGHKADQSEI